MKSYRKKMLHCKSQKSKVDVCMCDWCALVECFEIGLELFVMKKIMISAKVKCLYYFFLFSYHLSLLVIYTLCLNVKHRINL